MTHQAKRGSKQSIKSTKNDPKRNVNQAKKETKQGRERQKNDQGIDAKRKFFQSYA